MAGEAVAPEWPTEHLPDENEVYLRVPRQIWQDAVRKAKLEPSGVSPSWFRHTADDPTVKMSCDWCKYATPEQTRTRFNPDPNANAVIAIVVGRVRDTKHWEVMHSPDVARDNQAHADITGPADSHPRARVAFARAARVALALPESE